MREIFISYRREDSEGWAGRFADALQKEFGSRSVFFDFESIEPSSNWRNTVEQALMNCKLMIALIGPRWITATDAGGGRRLDDPEDLVRFELATALTRRLPVLPLLVGKASLPKPADLPTELRAMLNHQAFELPSHNWNHDIESLVRAVETIVGMPRIQPAKPGVTANVGEGALIEDAEAGSVIGVKGSRGARQVGATVAKHAVIRRSKIQDIVGVEITDNNSS